jgi:hypothetical protein
MRAPNKHSVQIFAASYLKIQVQVTMPFLRQGGSLRNPQKNVKKGCYPTKKYEKIPSYTY